MAPSSNSAAHARNRFKRTLSEKTRMSFKDDGLDVLVYLAYIKFLTRLQNKVNEKKATNGTPENLLSFYKEASEETMREFRG